MDILDMDFDELCIMLPIEIRSQIWQLAMPPTIVPAGVPTGYYDMDESITNSLALVNREAYSEVLRSHNLGCLGAYGQFYYFSYIDDVIELPGMLLPHFRPRTLPDGSPSETPLPFRSAFCHLKRPSMMWLEEADMGTISKEPVLETPLNLVHLPQLRRFAFTYEDARPEWWIDGFQEFGPEIVGQPDAGSNWKLRYDADYLSQGSKHCAGKGMIADTGIRWEVHSGINSMATKVAYEYLEEHPEDVCKTWNKTWEPKIGFKGYSMGSSQKGGQWAGFRYFVSEQRVEFSPLSWAEVKQFCTTTASFRLMSRPELVVIIFVILPGEGPPKTEPHHCWETVQEYTDNEAKSATQIRCLWQWVKGDFNSQTISVWGDRLVDLKYLEPCLEADE